VTTTRVDKPTGEERDRLREELAQQIKEYLAKGGKVTQCPDRTFTQTEGPRRKFDGGRNDSLTDPTNRDVGAVRPTKNKGGSE
jgi:hypothetical protein